MQGEQRCKEQRIEVARPIEILDPEIGLGVAGYTKNLSASGMRARVDVAPSQGDVVKLAIALAEGRSPLETDGEVIWCEPDAAGEGAEVGLKFLDQETGAPEKAARGEDDTTKIVLQPGQRVTIDSGGQTLQAVVKEVSGADGDPAGVELSLSLAATDEGCAITTGEDGTHEERELLESAEDWKPHPFRDVAAWVVKYCGPVLAVVWPVLAAAGRIAARLAVRGYEALPEKIRRRLEAGRRRLPLLRRT